MKITTEKRLNAKGDKQTIRLVYWYGSHVDADGKIKHDRKLEQLDLYLFPKPVSKFEKQHNKETLKLVDQIKSKRIAEEQAAAAQRETERIARETQAAAEAAQRETERAARAAQEELDRQARAAQDALNQAAEDAKKSKWNPKNWF